MIVYEVLHQWSDLKKYFIRLWMTHQYQHVLRIMRKLESDIYLVHSNKEIYCVMAVVDLIIHYMITATKECEREKADSDQQKEEKVNSEQQKEEKVDSEQEKEEEEQANMEEKEVEEKFENKVEIDY